MVTNQFVVDLLNNDDHKVAKLLTYLPSELLHLCWIWKGWRQRKWSHWKGKSQGNHLVCEMLYSIRKTRKKETCRPYKQGDSHTYSQGLPQLDLCVIWLFVGPFNNAIGKVSITFVMLSSQSYLPHHLHHNIHTCFFYLIFLHNRILRPRNFTLYIRDKSCLATKLCVQF